MKARTKNAPGGDPGAWGRARRCGANLASSQAKLKTPIHLSNSPTGAEEKQTDLGIYVQQSARGSLLVVVIGLGSAISNLGGNQPRVSANGRFNGVGHIRVLLQEILGIIAALANALAIIGIPRA